ncbi:hypothetical protein [Halopseudomonas pelagia]|uniref:hypothetical protein n=1 Tax=Halopseudomonas pelagia TaxID=553151 RepID=UPI0003A1F8FA|nr:hypothetical protein [Halopseudomonas pelagia]|tara:strand:- start:74002 stop:74361 length:360 start_codon:yes stop_codon:yes gene_type:complete
MVTLQPIVFEQVETLSFRQIDQLNSLTKGASFKLFKTYQRNLLEGRDYFYLPQEQYAQLLDALKRTEQIYASTVHLVLLTRQGYSQLQILSAQGGPQNTAGDTDAGADDGAGESPARLN